jgi:hypothetical protein
MTKNEVSDQITAEIKLELKAHESQKMKRRRFALSKNINLGSCWIVKLLDDGAIPKCINREIALADKDFTREYMQARKYGLGEKGAFRIMSSLIRIMT